MQCNNIGLAQPFLISWMAVQVMMDPDMELLAALAIALSEACGLVCKNICMRACTHHVSSRIYMSLAGMSHSLQTCV